MIVFRCDSSFEIGTGHVARDLALAQKLRSLGMESHFVCRDLPGNISSRVQEQSFGLSLLSAQDNDQEVILSLKPKWLVVDHYGLDESWERFFDGQVPLFVIDDLMNRKHVGQILLDQNFHENALSKYRALTSSQTRLLLGPQFALFNLAADQKTLKDFSKPAKKVLVFFGGADHSGETFKFLEALKSHQTRHFFHIVVTPSNPKIAEFRSLPKGSNYEVLILPPTWQELLKNSDLFLGSGGTVTWERMAVGLPGAIISVAENQTEIAQDLAHAGYQIFLGLHTQIQYSEILSKIEILLKNSGALKQMSEKGLNLVRSFPLNLIGEIFEPIGAQPFQLKTATLQNSRFLFELRNDPQTRAMSRSTAPVDWETHSKWLEKKLQEPRTRLYVAYSNGKPCAQFRVELSGETSIGIAEAFRGQGLSSRIIQAGCSLYAAEFQLDRPFTAQIKPENQASRRSFEKAGFRIFNDSNVNELDYITLTFDARSARGLN